MDTRVNQSLGGTLISAATYGELATFGLEDAHIVEEGRLWKFPGAGHAGPDHFATVTGVGIPHTLLRLAPLLENLRPARVLNIGIAGAYFRAEAYGDAMLEIGDVVIGTSEVFADLGMEIPEEEAFRSLGAFPFADDSLRTPLPLELPAWAVAIPGLKRGSAATVNACTGTDATGALRLRLFDTAFESMEGAAVALACREKNIPVVEIRAISNFAARRDLRPENIDRAVEALSSFWAAHRDAVLHSLP